MHRLIFLSLLLLNVNANVKGDGKTPYGAYPMRGGFGIYANPGRRRPGS